MPGLKDAAKSEQHADTAEGGMVLLDLSLKVVAFDRGAAAILKNPNQPSARSGAFCLPKEILDHIRNRKFSQLSSVRTFLRIRKNDYICRPYLLEWHNWLSPQPIVAIHLERVSSATDAVYEVSAAYQLTNREQEVLRGISLGLSSKVMAERMAISPNTVKAFLRLIMIKMGVTSRAGIVANILQNRSSAEKRGPMQGAIPPKGEPKELPSARSAIASAGSSPLPNGQESDH